MLKPSLQIFKKPIKNPRITIKTSQKIIVSVPLHFSSYHTQAFIEYHQKWIDKTLAKISKNHQDLSDEILSHIHQILIFGQWQDIATLSYPLQKNAFKELLHTYIAPRTQELANTMNLDFQHIKITNACSKFGSCTYDNRLFFSLMLVFAPYHLIDYVIIHELAHIHHKNHSQDFWHLVTKHCPHAKDYRAQLRKEAKLYLELLQKLS
uniref:Metalloprotease n=1 Tax=uncultured Helicobacter sp. TaxID=175537 RepID=A0A650EJT4_9HELI|nr:metalloprotease [uncultured Helicobacter sp.]